MKDFNTTYDHDLEQIVLGTLMMDKDAVHDVADFVTIDCFHDPNHNIIYKSIIELSNEGTIPDILTVYQRLKEHKATNLIEPVYLTELTGRVAGSANLEKHCRILVQLMIKRKTVRIGNDLVHQARDSQTDALQMVSDCMTNVSNLVEGSSKSREAASTELFQQLRQEMQRVNNLKDNEVTGQRTNLKEFDKKLGGFQNGHLFIVAGRPGMGKTAFTKAVINGAITQGRGACMFSLEMTKEQLTGRIISERAQINSSKFTKGGFDAEEFDRASKAMDEFYDDQKNELLIIDDTAGLSITELSARAKRIDRKYNPSVYIVDYLQLMTGSSKGGGRVNEVGEISRGLKKLAKDINKPFVVLSQLSRGVESRDNRKPVLSDLRESGDIEQDADGVMFVYRPHYYFLQGHEQFKEVEVDGITRDSEGIAQLILAKNRHGSVGSVNVAFIDKFTQFADLDTAPDPIPYNPNRAIEPNTADYGPF